MVMGMYENLITEEQAVRIFTKPRKRADKKTWNRTVYPLTVLKFLRFTCGEKNNTWIGVTDDQVTISGYDKDDVRCTTFRIPNVGLIPNGTYVVTGVDKITGALTIPNRIEWDSECNLTFKNKQRQTTFRLMPVEELNFKYPPDQNFTASFEMSVEGFLRLIKDASDDCDEMNIITTNEAGYSVAFDWTHNDEVGRTSHIRERFELCQPTPLRSVNLTEDWRIQGLYNPTLMLYFLKMLKKMNLTDVLCEYGKNIPLRLTSADEDVYAEFWLAHLLPW